MKLSDLIVWLAILIFFTDAGQTLIELIHGPQPKTTIEAPSVPTTPKSDGELKSSW